MPDRHGYPSTPWDWAGGYPQRITGPDATLIAEVYENPVPCSPEIVEELSADWSPPYQFKIEDGELVIRRAENGHPR